MEDVKVYMVVNLQVKDKDTYLKYEKGFFPILKRHGGEFITYDDSFEHMEGSEPLTGGRMIIFSFPCMSCFLSSCTSFCFCPTYQFLHNVII